MGGRSRSSSSNQTTTNNTTNEVTFSNVDNRVIDGDGNIVGGNNTINAAGDVSDVTLTDFGAIAGALGFAESSMDTVEKALAGIENISSESINTVLALSEEREEQAQQTVATIAELATVVQTNGESLKQNNYLLLGGVALAITGLIVWHRKK